MAILPALRAAAVTYRAVRTADGTSASAGAVKTSTVPYGGTGAYLPVAEAARAWDYITNGWAAVSAAWGAFWGSLREWGGTGYTDLAAAVASNPTSGRAMRLLCDNAAAVPVVAYMDREGTDEEHPSSAALAAVKREGWDTLVTRYLWGLYCGGEAFFLKSAPTSGPDRGKVWRVTPLRNDLFVRVERDRLGDPVRYVFSKAYGRSGVGRTTDRTDTYDADEVLHVRLFHPADAERGLPIVLSARRPLTIVEEADAWNRGIARGGGRVPGYFKPQGLQPSEVLDPETVRKAQTQSDTATAERQRLNLPQVLSGAFDYVSASVSPREADWLKGRQVAMREIAAVMGVSPTLLADEKAGSLTDAGVDSEVAALYKLTVQPLVARLLAELTRFLCEEGERLDADWDQVPALQEDMDAKYVRYLGAVEGGLLTRKEGRVAVGYGAEPEAGMEDDGADTRSAPPPVPPIPEPVPPADPDDPADDTSALKALSPAAFERLLDMIPAASGATA